MQEIKCSLCGATMIHNTLRGNEFWGCPVCRAETWPYDEQVEREIRQMMYSIIPPKRGGGKRRRRFKPKKPGEKWVPWYRRK